jgi:hypothetical protein
MCAGEQTFRPASCDLETGGTIKKILFLAVVALSVTACVGTPWVITASSDRAARPERNVSQAPNDSVLLGEQDVDFKVDHDKINVRGYEGSFRSLFFLVEKNDIELFDLVVVFENGDRQRIDTRLVFNEGSRSRLIDLNGGERRIKSIQFTYRTVGTWAEGKARVAVYGVK